ncbi:hypothetical protein HJFPF1_02650 [Paramyrothecium foliicola]|nr:hypothetical protein HJFPF1_02650 [Paramyrothecium foliicola]
MSFLRLAHRILATRPGSSFWYFGDPPETDMAGHYPFTIHPWCVFCRFEFEEHDRPAIDFGDHWHVASMEQMANKIEAVDEPNPTHPFVANEDDDEFFWVPDNIHLACHPQCLDLVGLANAKRFAKSTAYSFPPPAQENRRRRNWLRVALVTVLRESGPSTVHPTTARLPAEIWHNIADNLLQEFAVTKFKALWRPKRENDPRDRPICIEKELWCGVVEIEGNEYISALASHSSEETPALLTSFKDQAPDLLLVSSNSLGIISIIPTCREENHAIEEQPGVFWQSIDLCDCKDDLPIGVKISSVTHGRRIIPRWCVPEPLRLRAEALYMPTSDAVMPRRWQSLECNNPAITGYSIKWRYGPVALHAHTTGEDMSFYHYNENAVWLYLPLEEGEVLSRIWTRTGIFAGVRAVTVYEQTGTSITRTYLKLLDPSDLKSLMPPYSWANRLVMTSAASSKSGLHLGLECNSLAIRIRQANVDTRSEKGLYDTYDSALRSPVQGRYIWLQNDELTVCICHEYG